MALDIEYSTCTQGSFRRKPELLTRLPLVLAAIAYVFLMGVVLFA